MRRKRQRLDGRVLFGAYFAKVGFRKIHRVNRLAVRQTKSAEKFDDRLPGFGVDFFDGFFGVNDSKTIRFLSGEFEISGADAFVKIGFFLVHPVFLLAGIAADVCSCKRGFD